MTPTCLRFQPQALVVVLLNLVVGLFYKSAAKVDLNPLRILCRRLKFNVSECVVGWVDVHWQRCLMETGGGGTLVKSALSGQPFCCFEYIIFSRENSTFPWAY